MSDLKEYLDLKKQYEKLKYLIENIKAINEIDNESIFREFTELSGWFLVKMDDLERKANEDK